MKISLLLSNYDFFTEIIEVFHLIKIDTMEKISPKYFIVIFSYRYYYVISWILLDSKR